MLEPPRIGLPNLVGQGELLARRAAAQAGAEHAARDTIAAGLRHEALQRRAGAAADAAASRTWTGTRQGQDGAGLERSTAGASTATTSSRTMERTGTSWT